MVLFEECKETIFVAFEIALKDLRRDHVMTADGLLVHSPPGLVLCNSPTWWWSVRLHVRRNLAVLVQRNDIRQVVGWLGARQKYGKLAVVNNGGGTLRYVHRAR